MPALARLLERGTPAPVEPDRIAADITADINADYPAIDNETDCICRMRSGGFGQNPECPEHPWWRHDTDVLDLADLTRELGSALAAARRHADNLNEAKRSGVER